MWVICLFRIVAAVLDQDEDAPRAAVTASALFDMDVDVPPITSVNHTNNRSVSKRYIRKTLFDQRAARWMRIHTSVPAFW